MLLADPNSQYYLFLPQNWLPHCMQQCGPFQDVIIFGAGITIDMSSSPEHTMQSLVLVSSPPGWHHRAPAPQHQTLDSIEYVGFVGIWLRAGEFDLTFCQVPNSTMTAGREGKISWRCTEQGPAVSKAGSQGSLGSWMRGRKSPVSKGKVKAGGLECVFGELEALLGKMGTKSGRGWAGRLQDRGTSLQALAEVCRSH